MLVVRRVKVGTELWDMFCLEAFSVQHGWIFDNYRSLHLKTQFDLVSS